MHEAIKTWLDQDGPYQAGLTLLEQAGVRGIMLRTLSLGEDAYNRGLLTQQLQQILAKPIQAGPPGGPANNVLPEVTMVSCTAVKNADDYSAPVAVALDYGASDNIVVMVAESADYLRDQANDLMNERTELKARLRYSQAPEQQADRRDWAFRILAITDTLDDIYSRLDFLAEYGYLPPKEEPAADIDDTAALANVRTYVSKYTAKLKKKTLTPEQRQNAQRLLDKYTSEKNRLELKLSRTNDSHPTG